MQIFADVPIYCCGLWLNLGMSILINFAFHVGFCVLSRGKLGIHQWGCVLKEDDANDGDDEQPMAVDGDAYGKDRKSEGLEAPSH
jgi:hypothetical protein